MLPCPAINVSNNYKNILQTDWSFKDKGEDSGTEPRPAELLAEGGGNTEGEIEGG